MSDYDNIVRVARASGQILEAMEGLDPVLTQQRFVGRDSWYDLRGKVDDVVGLALVFTTRVGLRAGVQIPAANTGLSHIILLPQPYRRSWHRMVVATQSLLQHELAHVLLQDLSKQGQGHRVGTEAYFNDPDEIEAYMHQAISRFVREAHPDQFSWTRGPLSPEELVGAKEAMFVARVLAHYPGVAWRKLTEENRNSLRQRLEGVYREALNRPQAEMPVENDMQAIPGL